MRFTKGCLERIDRTRLRDKSNKFLESLSKFCNPEPQISKIQACSLKACYTQSLTIVRDFSQTLPVNSRPFGAYNTDYAKSLRLFYIDPLATPYFNTLQEKNNYEK